MKREWKALLLALAAALAVGGALLWRTQAVPAPHAAEIERLFAEGAAQLQQRHYEAAIKALHHVLLLAPRLPEAQVNMGYALLGLNRPKDALTFFDSATGLRPDQANAYYGLALAHEATGDVPAATGAMRTYLHLARDEKPEHLARARAALWEWEQQRAGR